jgi:hypothetical protein
LVGRSAQKGGLYVGKTKRGKGTKIMAMVDRSGLPLAIDLESASPHESTLLENLLRQSFLRRVVDRPRFLIGDKAYDSDPLDARLARQGITLLAQLPKARHSLRVPCRKLPRLPSPRLRDFPAQAFMKCSLVTPMG